MAASSTCTTRRGKAIVRIARPAPCCFHASSSRAPGEPTLHKRCAEFVAAATARRFETEIYTNASRLTVELAEALAAAGLRQLNASFWGTTRDEYAESMRLDFDRTLSLLHQAIPRLQTAGVGVKMTGQRAPGVRSTDDDVLRFWNEQFPGIEVDMESTPENRAGNLSCAEIEPGLEFYPPVDYSKPIWCSFSYFTDFICWNGDVLMCSPDFFGRHMYVGNVGVDTLAALSARKADAMRDLRFRASATSAAATGTSPRVLGCDPARVGDSEIPLRESAPAIVARAGLVIRGSARSPRRRLARYRPWPPVRPAVAHEERRAVRRRAAPPPDIRRLPSAVDC